ncbi:hypothetical protein OYE22_17330 [Streptomyces sp. 71268]|uniref:hypothetical protein n=1 Tax=Streptomyces sp. 71268 TaxID=3002640 RepID=UPI0023F78BF7|nr:hypothetical protein [Streptomyces sp. 71268]WEV26764.1 hypothetical protein OYE22_17330 [Streptomyces sp. 71268]
METLIVVFAIAAMIALGVLVIHQLNAQHEDRIAHYPYDRSRRDGGAHPDGARSRFRPHRRPRD